MRRLSLFAALLTLAACPFYGQAHRQSQVLQRGNAVSAEVVPFAQIQVCAAGTADSTCGAVSIYSDYSLSTPILGLITADASGNYDYFTNAACVDEIITSPGTDPKILPYVCQSPGAGTGTVTNFSAGNLTPLFTTTVTNATTAPNLAFNLSQSPTYTFYGNFTSGTAVPDFWKLVAGSNITLTPNTGTKTLTLAAAEGVTSFTSGNLSPLFTTTVANATTTPSQIFSLSQTSNFTFYGNFSGVSATPQFWTLACGANLTCSTSGTTLTLAAASSPTRSWSCQTGIGDGANAIPAATYHTTFCKNETGATITLTGIRCVLDTGASTCDATNGAGTELLTGPITGVASYASGTQSTTTTLASGDYVLITYVADGTSKQVGIDFAGTY